MEIVSLRGTKSKNLREKCITIFQRCKWSNATGYIYLFDGNRVEEYYYSTNCVWIELYEL